MKTPAQMAAEVLEKVAAFEGTDQAEWKEYVRTHNLPLIRLFQAGLIGGTGAFVGGAMGLWKGRPGLGALLGGGAGLAASIPFMLATQSEFNRTTPSQWAKGLEMYRRREGLE